MDTNIPSLSKSLKPKDCSITKHYKICVCIAEHCPPGIHCVNGGYLGSHCRCVCPNINMPCHAITQPRSQQQMQDLQDQQSKTTFVAPSKANDTKGGSSTSNDLDGVFYTDGQRQRPGGFRFPNSQIKGGQRIIQLTTSNMMSALQALFGPRLGHGAVPVGKMVKNSGTQQRNLRLLPNKGRGQIFTPGAKGLGRFLAVRKQKTKKTPVGQFQKKTPRIGSSRPRGQMPNRSNFLFHIPGSVIMSAVRDAVREVTDNGRSHPGSETGTPVFLSEAPANRRTGFKMAKRTFPVTSRRVQDPRIYLFQSQGQTAQNIRPFKLYRARRVWPGGVPSGVLDLVP